MVRSLKYMQTKKKQGSEAAIYQCVSPQSSRLCVATAAGSECSFGMSLTLLMLAGL